MSAPDSGFLSAASSGPALDAVVVMGADGLVRDWNPAAEVAFGFTLERVSTCPGPWGCAPLRFGGRA